MTSFISSGMFKKILFVLSVGFLAWAYQATRPPPKICGSPDGPVVTASRIKLRDGRHLAYKEYGVPRDKSNYKIVYIHGIAGGRQDVAIDMNLSEETIESLGVYAISFDRPGYGESDPHPERTVKSIAYDIEELADQLELGSKFYVMGFSMGGQVVWTCLKYIPHRLAGAALLAPVVNFWWPGLPANISTEAYKRQLPQDQWTFRVAHYMPWLTYWWSTQKFFPSFSLLGHGDEFFSRQDKELLPKILSAVNELKVAAQTTQQGEFESIYRDLIIGYGTWEFDPLDLENPFPNNEGCVHLYTGDEDRLVPVTLERYIVKRLPWISYHEVKGSGHLFPYLDGMGDSIVKALLSGKCYLQ